MTEIGNEVIVELKAVEDDGVLGTGRRHFVFPHKPDGAKRALHPIITGGIWIKRDANIPDTIVIKLT